MMRVAVLFVALVGCAGASPAPASKPPAANAESGTEQPIPDDLRDDIERSLAIGKRLYVLDKVAALGTDVLFANVPDAQSQGLAGYLPLQEGDGSGQPIKSFLVSFFTDENPPRIVYEVRIQPDVEPAFQAFKPPKETVAGFAALVHARQVAIDAMPATSQPVNPVVMPAESADGVLVYLLAGTKTPNLAVFGRHFRAEVSLGTNSVRAMTPLSNSVLEVPTRGPNGEAVEALVVTHVVTDYPLETHVFTSLLMKLPVYVATKRGNWLVKGDEIAFFGGRD